MRSRLRWAVGLAVAASTLGGCRSGAELPDSWRRVGVGHGSIVVPGDMRPALEERRNKLCIQSVDRVLNVCGTEMPIEPDQGTELPYGVGPDPSYAKLPGVSIERTAPRPGLEVIFKIKESFVRSWVLAREGPYLVEMHDSGAEFEDLMDLRPHTDALAASWRGGPQQCEPNRMMLASGSFADRPSPSDSTELRFGSVDARTTLEVSLWHTRRKDRDAYVRLHLLAHRFSIPFTRAFARMISLGRSDFARSMRQDLRETPIREYVRVIRRRRRTVGGMRGAEVVFVPRPDQGESPTMVMVWAFAGRPGRADRPSASVTMTHPYDRKAFRSVLREWDRIVPTLQALRSSTDACVNASSLP